MRMFPAVPEGIRRITPSTGATIGGHFIPANVSNLLPLSPYHPLTPPLPKGQSQHPSLRSLPPPRKLYLTRDLRPRTLAPLFPPLVLHHLCQRQKRRPSTLLRGS